MHKLTTYYIVAEIIQYFVSMLSKLLTDYTHLGHVNIRRFNAFPLTMYSVHKDEAGVYVCYIERKIHDPVSSRFAAQFFGD